MRPQATSGKQAATMRTSFSQLNQTKPVRVQSEKTLGDVGLGCAGKVELKLVELKHALHSHADLAGVGIVCRRINLD
jgi:hypothetical protein